MLDRARMDVVIAVAAADHLDGMGQDGVAGPDGDQAVLRVVRLAPEGAGIVLVGEVHRDHIMVGQEKPLPQPHIIRIRPQLAALKRINHNVPRRQFFQNALIG